MELGEQVSALLEQMLQVARLIRERCGYSEKQEQFLPIALVIAASGEVDIMGLAMGGRDAMRAAMQLVWQRAREVESPLVVLVNDTTFGDMDKLTEYFSMPSFRQEPELWKRCYGELHAQYGELRNFPHECWHDALVVISKSPVFPLQMHCLHYDEGEHDGVRWGKVEKTEDGKDGHQLELPMLPDWWKEESAQVQ